MLSKASRVNGIEMIRTPPRALNPRNQKSQPDLTSPPNLTKNSRRRKGRGTTDRVRKKSKDKARVPQIRKTKNQRKRSGRLAARVTTRPVSKAATAKRSSRRSPAASTSDTATTGSLAPIRRNRETPATMIGGGQRESRATTGRAPRRPRSHARSNQKASPPKRVTMSRLAQMARTTIPRASSEYYQSARSFVGRLSCGLQIYWPVSYSSSLA